MNIKVAALLAIIVSVGGAAAYSVLRGNEEQRFSVACIEEIKKRLDRPASFTFTRTDRFSREPATFTTMFGLNDPLKAAYTMTFSAEMMAAMKSINPADYDVLSL